MKLQLYMFETCPFCRKVINYIKESGRMDVEFCDIHKSDDNKKTLLEIGGKEQVPCLFIDGKPLYESEDIITWLKEHPAGDK